MAAQAVAGLCGGARSRLLQGAVQPAGALCMQHGLAATVARLWQGAAGGAAAFHTTAPCEVRMKMRGTVVGDKAQKTVVVAVERTFKHPVVKKYVKERSKFMAHDELDQFKVGDEIWIEEHRPISRRKRWMALGYVDPSLKALEVPPVDVDKD